jgi:hypothetical protein
MPLIRAATRQIIVGVGDLRRSGAGPTVRYFPSPRRLTPDRTLCQRCLDHGIPTTCHANRNLPNITRHRNSILDLQTSTPQYSSLPQSRGPPTMAHGCPTAWEGRGRSAYVASEILALAPVLDVNKCHVRLDRNQLRGHGQGTGGLCERCQERLQVPHQYVQLSHISQFRSHNSFTGNWNFEINDICILTDDAKYPGGTPTKANILNAMKWLVEDARAGDSLFIHCECALYIQTTVRLCVLRLWPRYADRGQRRR